MKELFRIFEIDESLVEKILTGPSPDTHRHDYEELIFLTAGSLEHFIDFRSEVVSAPAVCYVPEGKIHRLHPRRDLRGWVVNYKHEYLPDSQLRIYSPFITDSNLPLRDGSCVDRYETLCRMISGEFRREDPDLNMLRHLVYALTAMVDSDRKRTLPEENNARASQVSAFHQFLRLLEEHFREDKGVSFYAGQMNMSERNLNLIVRNNFQKSVSELIEARRLTEAKHLLLNTGKTVSEIGFELGYNEKSYFTRVFHARTGLTPTAFREQMKSLLS